MNTTPLTDLLAYYRQLSEQGNRGLASRLKLAQRLARRPSELVAIFTRSLSQFERYSNPTQFFHEGEILDGKIAAAGRPIFDACAPVPSPPPAVIRSTFHFAQALCANGDCSVIAAPELAFRYVDRELDCLRTFPGQKFDDETPSKRAIVLDLLLENKVDSTPIVAELKIRKDEDAAYGLIQCLCAAAHLVTAPQRARLRNVYGLTSALKDCGPYLDLYVIFFEPKVEGLWPVLLRETLALRDGLMHDASITSMLRRIEFLQAAQGKTGLAFRLLR